MATVGRFSPSDILYCSLLAFTFCSSRAYSLVDTSAAVGSAYSAKGGSGSPSPMSAATSTLSSACPVYCASRRRAVASAFSTVIRPLRVSFLRRLTCSRSFLSDTPAFTAASASLANSASCCSTAVIVLSFSLSITTCQKYVSAVSTTSFSDSLRCRRLDSTPTSANLLALIMRPPVNKGNCADTPPEIPFLSSPMPIPSPRLICSSSSSAMKPIPVALTVGKYFVKACFFACRAASTSLPAFFIFTLFSKASLTHWSIVITRCAVIVVAASDNTIVNIVVFVVIVFIFNALILLLFYSVHSFPALRGAAEYQQVGSRQHGQDEHHGYQRAVAYHRAHGHPQAASAQNHRYYAH
ncbi:unknown [Prevotella sp. CAG:1124]|nr:unknown [Prevotella sp. CAG:1124]